MRGAGAREESPLGFVFVFIFIIVFIMFIIVGNDRESSVVVDVVLNPHISATPSLPPSPSTPPPPPVDVSKGDPNTDIWGRAFVGVEAERAVVVVNLPRSATADHGMDAVDNNKRNNGGDKSSMPTRAP